MGAQHPPCPRFMCTGKIDGVIRKGKLYMIPANAQKPADGRLSRVSLLAEIETKRERLAEMASADAGRGGAAPGGIPDRLYLQLQRH